jgi:hypothetical protein
VNTLIAHDPADKFRMMDDMLVSHGDEHICRDAGTRRPPKIVDSQATGTGAIIATHTEDSSGAGESG